MTVEYYSILGVEKTASEADIKKAYRKLASKLHPDKGGSKEEFQKLQEAYSVLGDPAKRAEYDQPRPQFNFNVGGQGSPFGQGGIDIEQMFNMFRGGPERRQPQPQRIAIELSLEDAARGGKRLITVSAPSGNFNAELDVPKGVLHGEHVRYPGLAPHNQDLVVTFRVNGHPVFERDGLDVRTTRDLDFWDLILGTTIDITDLQGRNLSLTVPPKFRPGAQLRAKGHGIERNGHETGSLYVKVNAKVPDNIPDSLLEEIKKAKGH